MKRLLLACIPTAARRSRTCVLLLALTASLSAVPVPLAPLQPVNTGTDYLFMPGHGLTRRTVWQPKILSDVVYIAYNQINLVGAQKVKISFIEEAYTWAELQPDNSNVSNINIDRLTADLEKCYNKGLRLRVFLSTHKYKESFPIWIYDPIPGDGYPVPPTNNDLHTVIVESGPSGDVPMVKLHEEATFLLLKQLYQEVIRQLKALPPELQDTFYGFVLQESNQGTNSPLTDPQTDQWFFNLGRLHQNLGWGLQDFTTAGGRKPHRLFWQMINYPADRTSDIVASVLANHGGLCGPDTFPREPHLRNNHGPNFETGLAEAYAEIRAASHGDYMPTSLHVYALNYNKPYQGGVPLSPANQPIFDPSTNEDGDANNDDDVDNDGHSYPDNLLTPNGIANFLGCVPSPHANSLNVHNVVWSLADDPNNQQFTPPQGAWTGWSRVKTWMANAAQTVPGYHGGCNNTTPDSISNAP